MRRPKCPMGLCDLRGNVESQSQPPLARAGFAAEERFEQLVHRRCRNCLTGIADPELERIVPRFGVNDDGFVGRSMRHRVAEKIGEKLADADAITIHRLIDRKLGFRAAAHCIAANHRSGISKVNFVSAGVDVTDRTPS